MEIIDRKDIKKEDTWDLESLFKDREHWERTYREVVKLADNFKEHKDKVSLSSENLLKALKDRDELYRNMENIYSYAHMRFDEDTQNVNSQELSDKGLKLYVDTIEKTSFLVPEILNLSKEQLEKFIEERDELKLYKKFLEDILRQKSHVLSPREESILAQMGEIGNTPSKIFSMLNDADLKFPIVKDENGNDIELNHSNFIPMMESKDRKTRENAFKKFYGVYDNFKNTFAAILDGEIKNNMFNSQIRNYNSNREASLDDNNIPEAVYDNLIEAIGDNLDTMHKYMGLRKKVLNVKELHMYDIYTPLVEEVEFKPSYKESLENIKEALKPLKDEYLAALDEGLNSRWIDIHPNRGKRSGAYSGGSYDSKPFILLNYQNTLDNMFTIIHEMGHSLHSYFTRKNQPYIYGNYSIFVAEVASTVNEAILMDYMIRNSKDKKEKAYMINHYLEKFRTTMFRQTMFAEFEYIINKYLESGGALTADYLSKTYGDLNKSYYGKDVVIDKEITMEWARIPHFYYNFYVFQYATGFAAAISLSKKILNGEEAAVDNYLNFLKSGSSEYPIEVLKKAGVDMSTKGPVEDALKLFKDLVAELENSI